MNPDAELLQHYARTREAAPFTALVQRYMPMVYRAAWRQLGGDAHAAEDVAQMVFTLLARKAGGLGSHANLAGWLHVATRHVVRDHLRSVRRRATREQEAVRMNSLSGDDDSGAGIDWDRLRPLLDEALGDLRAADREALLLRYFQGLSLAAVGSSLAVGEEAARMRVNRALERLRDQLARRGIKSTAAALGMALATEPAIAAPPVGFAAVVSGTALTQAATGGIATLAGSWLLMNTMKMAATGAVALAAVGWATWEYGQQEKILQEAIRAEAVAAKIAVTPKTPPAVPASADEPAGKSPSGSTPAPAEPAASRNARRERDAEAVARGDALLAAHSELRAAFAESRRASNAASLVSFYVTQGLTAGQRQAFDELSLQASAGRTSLGGFGDARDVTFQLPKLIDEKEWETRLTALLGTEGMAAFRAWQGTQDGASEVREVAGWAAELDQPMTTEQARALRTIFATTKPSAAGQDAVYWDKIITRATAVLAPAQLEALALQKARAELRLADAAAKAELAAKQGGG